MANVRTPRRAWLEAARGALAEGGPEAVRVEALAADLGVTKGGFYWHFTDRKTLLEELLESWEKSGTEDIIVLVDSQQTDPRPKLRQLFGLTPAADGLTVELAIRDWSRRDDRVAERLRRVDNRRMAYMRSLFAQFCPDDDDVEARCMLAYSLMFGSYFIAAEHGDKRRSHVLNVAFDRLLSDSWQ